MSVIWGIIFCAVVAFAWGQTSRKPHRPQSLAKPMRSPRKAPAYIADGTISRRQFWEDVHPDGRCFYADANVDVPWPTDGTAEEVEHIIPRSAGGPDVLWNLVPADRGLNRSKSATMLPAETIERLVGLNVMHLHEKGIPPGTRVTL